MDDRKGIDPATLNAMTGMVQLLAADTMSSYAYIPPMRVDNSTRKKPKNRAVMARRAKNKNARRQRKVNRK